MSVSYKLFFTALLVFVSAPSLAQPEPERHYRVELIVVRHLDGSSDSTPQQQLRDLTELLDLYAPADVAAKELQATPPATSAPPDLDTQSGLAPEEPAAVRVDDMSDTMRESWRRLRGSAGFRPELFRAWEQSGDQPAPNLRIHDDELLFEIEPDGLQDQLPKDQHGAVVFSDQTLQGQQNNPDGSEAAPPTQYYYRIDGSARLTRTRFLHLDLDIELREPLYGPPEQDPGIASGEGETAPSQDNEFQADAADDTGSALAAIQEQRTGPAAQATAFRIHHIGQRRQVKAEQMEYFDGPVIGILALVTGFDVIATDSATDSIMDSTGDGLDPVE